MKYKKNKLPNTIDKLVHTNKRKEIMKAKVKMRFSLLFGSKHEKNNF